MFRDFRMPFRRLFRRIRWGEPLVVVSGLPRSGTSMVMRMLESGGIPLVTDRAREPDEDNPVGYFEDERTKRLLDTADRSWLAEYRGRAIKVVSPLLEGLPENCAYDVLFLERDLDEVISSQARMLERAGEDRGDDAVARRAYEGHLRKARALLRTDARFRVLTVPHRDALSDPSRVAGEIARFLGRRLDVPAMAAAVEPRLHRNRSKKGTKP